MQIILYISSIILFIYAIFTIVLIIRHKSDVTLIEVVSAESELPNTPEHIATSKESLEKLKIPNELNNSKS